MAWLGWRAAPDLVVAGHLAVLPAAAACAGRRPIALMAYGSELWAGWSRPIVGLLRSRVQRVVAISAFTGAECRRLGFEDVVVCAPGAELPDIDEDTSAVLAGFGLLAAPDGDPRPYLLTVARMNEPHKGHELVIRSLPTLLTSVPGLRYVVAGEGPRRRDLYALAMEHGVADSVLFTGEVTAAVKGALLRHCRALVMPSGELREAGEFEGFGLVFIEAALAGRPVIAGRAGGAPDAVVHGRTGLLVDPASAEDFAQAALLLLEDPQLGDRLGAAGRERAVGEYTMLAAAGRVDKVLRGLDL
jgi:phosphatidylinositol alpha-1,6-mannosyltransferase